MKLSIRGKIIAVCGALLAAVVSSTRAVRPPTLGKPMAGKPGRGRLGSGHDAHAEHMLGNGAAAHVFDIDLGAAPAAADGAELERH